MGLNERQKQLLHLVEAKQRISVSQLAKALYVSEMTVRRDLTVLERDGMLLRYHGGAVALGEYMQYPIGTRMHINEKEKREIAKLAEKHVRDGQTIFLPGSSTCAFLIPYLKKYEGIRVVTNSVRFLLALSDMGISCLLSGGEYQKSDQALVGRGAEQFLRALNFHIAFLACDGISDDGMVSVEKEDMAQIVRIGFEHAQKRIILSDRSKLGVRCTYNICNTEDADEILVI